MSNNVARNPITPIIPTSSAANPSPAQENPSPSSPPKSILAPQTSSLTTDLADRQDLKTLGQKLNQIATQLGKEASAADVLTALNTTPMELDPDSSYPRQSTTRTTVAAFIKSHGLGLPTDHFSLTGLAQAVNGRSMEHPLGNLSGALSWPVPLSSDEQRRLRNIAMSHAHHLGDQPLVMQTKGGVLAFLSLGNTLPAEILRDPAKLLDTLLMTPQAQLMGKALQEKMQGVATPSSSTDYLLAAMMLQLDPESITEPDRHKIAGFDLANPELIGKHPATYLQRLREHLVQRGKATPETADVAAYLLLASRAPALLVKNTPSSVTYGSPAWVNLAIAAATIEAQTPGKVANMTFAQVMLAAPSAAVADPALTLHAQREALLDWGVANGVISRKADHLYTPEELNSLVQTFNARKQQMVDASAALESELPSRKALAKEKLIERFGDLGQLFEEKVIEIKRKVPWLDDGKSYNSDASNPHSMLDVAMMELTDPKVEYFSQNSRIPILALNANHEFGVIHQFDEQFSQTIAAKKAGISTTIKHLIAQLPVQDRKNLEYGKLELYQTSSYTKGTGVSSRTNHPKNEKLLIGATLNGVSTAYEIDFNNGSIKQTYPHRLGNKTTTVAQDVFVTKPFAPTGSEQLHQENTQPGDSLPDNFSSARTQLLADTFVNHLDLDNPTIKEQARGLTTLDKHQRKIESLVEFGLNLIPFRSAIVNFQKGDYGEGALDLALDVFGFVTAGLGAASKVIKVAGTAASAVSKGLQAAKIIGSATIGALNPLDGLADALVGGSRLAARGAKVLASQGTELIHKLRGAAGNYDVLSAISKEHGTALIGSYTSASRNVDTIAVLKDNQWYRYNPVKNEPYGSPIKDFKPIGAGQKTLVTQGSHENYYTSLDASIKNAQLPHNRTAYIRGMQHGAVTSLADYRPAMDTEELRRLASIPGRPPEEVGILITALKNSEIEDARYASAILRNDVQAPGVRVTPVSQLHYLAHVDITSKGECAGLSNFMALAIHHGKEDLLMQNLYRAAGNITDPDAMDFIQELKNLQRAVGQKTTFHMGKTPTKRNAQDIIDDLTNAPASKTLRINTKDHGMIAGITVKPGKTEWFFYDPNSGMVKFETLRSMQEGMEKVLNSGGIAATLNPYGKSRQAREYGVSEFGVNDLETAGNIDTVSLNHLMNTPL